MIDKNLEIKKYPFLGFSKNLMEYFAIIGYEEDFINDVLIPDNSSGQLNKNKYPPTILNSITTSVDYGMVDNDLILTQLYPNIPLLIPISLSPPTPKPRPTSVINSFCFDTYDGKGKTFYVCYGYNFYEAYDKFYIPKSFCIISQFPFFTVFNKICTNILFIFENFYLGKEIKDEIIPIELLLYSVVNFIPSSINYNLHLDLFKHYLKNPIEGRSIEIKKLSGYPYVDFNLSEVFNLIPLTQFIQLFLLTVLEKNVLFVCPNLEMLNIVMYIFSILNYPCNDSTYFWHIVSVSKETLNEHSGENKFVSKIMASYLGINCPYSESLKVNLFSNPCYVYDLENKKLMYKKSLNLMEEDENEEESSKKIFDYIELILREKKTESKFLKKFVDILIRDLESLLRKNLNFSLNAKSKTIEFLETSADISSQNRKIQEAFYNFYLNLLMLFYQENTLKSSFEEIKKDKSLDKDEEQKYYFLGSKERSDNFAPEEKLFCEEFRNTVKYKIYFENFILEFNSLDLFKIPLLFSEEYINIKIKDENETFHKNLSFFDIMDKYYVDPQIGLDPMIEVTLNNLYSTTQEIIQKLNLTKRKMNLISLDKKVLQRFLYFINNQTKEELLLIYPSLSIKDTNIISTILKSKIQSLLESEVIEHNLASNKNLLVYSLILIYSMTCQLFSFNNIMTSLNIINSHLEKIDFFIRKFVYIILTTFFKYLLVHKEKGKFEHQVSQIRMCFYVLVNFMRTNHILPNEEMMVLLRLLNKEIEDELSDNGNRAEKEENEHNFDFSDESGIKVYMTYCFDRNGTKKTKEMIKLAMNSTKDKTIELNNNLRPKICISVFGKQITSEFFTPKKLYRISQEVFDRFIRNENLDVRAPEILPELKELIINLIYYCKHTSSIQNFDFILSACYLLFFKETE